MSRIESRISAAAGSLFKAGVTSAAWFALVLVVMACGDQTKLPPSAESEIAGLHSEETHESAEGGGHDEDEEAIEISLEVQERFGIEVEPAGAGTVEVTLDLPGEVRPDPDRIVHVKPPFSGVVTSVKKHVGDTVRSGDVLVVLESSQALANYPIRAAIDGTITEEHAPVGEFVDSSHVLLTIVDTSVVWVDLQVPPTDLRRVHRNDPVEVLLRGSVPGARGTISFVNPVVDYVTRTATARIVLANDGALPPGLFVTGRVVVAREEASVSVPSSALVRDGDDWVVFVREDDERFSRHPVVLSLQGIDRSAIEAGIDAGALVVSNGAFLVKSEAAQGEMGGGHGH